MALGSQSAPFFGAAGAAGGGGATGYEIQRSLRFNSTDSAYLNRTPSSAGNRKTWTWAGWVKRSALGAYQRVFSAYEGGSSAYTNLQLNNDDKLRLYGGSAANTNIIDLQTNAVFRDVSAWYHIVVAFDTTQSTSSDRTKIYVNGVQQTFSTATYPVQNVDYYINSTFQHLIGDLAGADYLNGYLADIHFIDGQALDPTSFGEFDDNGVWQPIEFTSPNNPNDGTTWSSDLTATTPGGYFSSSYPASNAFNGNLASSAVAEPNGGTITFAPTGGLTVNTSLEVYRITNAQTMTVSVNGGTSQSFADGQWVDLGFTGTLTSLAITAESVANPQISGIRVDGYVLVDGAYSYGRNGFHLDFADNSSAAALGKDTSVTIPNPAPREGMDVVTYTGNGGTQTIGGLQFQPDFVWVKQRNTIRDHCLVDSVRGATKRLRSNSSYFETTESVVTAFNSDGFNIGSDNGVNQSGGTYVGWCWKAGGTASLNENGSINSQVSANQGYGFSVVTYTGNGNASQSFGHGLSAAPKLVIIKNRDSTDSWRVYHADVGNTKALNLDLSVAPATGTGYWQNSSPTSSVVNIGLDSGVNTLSNNHVAYCWSEIAGFSKIGTYTGSGSTPVKVTTGFKPRFILARPIDHPDGNRWNLIDTKRGVTAERLFANNEETYSDRQEVQILDDGFNVIDATPDSGSLNRNTQYIYAAFADNPGNDWNVNNIATNSNPVYSNFLTTNGAKTGWFTGTPSDAFDGSLSTKVGGALGGDITFAPATAIPVASSLKIWADSGSGFGVGSGPYQIVYNGTQVYNSSMWAAGYEITAAAGTSLTSLVLDQSGSGETMRIFKIEVDGVVLIDGAGSGEDSLRDSPTDGSTVNDTGAGGEVPGNYCTMSPLVNRLDHAATFKNGNLEVTFADPQVYQVSYGTLAATSGKWYFEVTAGTFAGNTELSVGVSTPNPPQGTSDLSDKRRVYQYNGNKRDDVSGTAYGASWSTNDLIGCAFDLVNGTITFYKNGVSQGTAFTDLLTAMDPEGWVPYVYGFNVTYNVNFGQRAFAYSAPSGYKALCTANLTTPTIADGSTAMDVVLYTGDGNSTKTVSGLDFDPDLVWLKDRNRTGADWSHRLHNSVVGADLSLSSNSTDGDRDSSAQAGGGLETFVTGGFTLEAGTSDNNNANNLNTPYVAWSWDGASSTVSNTDGSITSFVRANASAGFSVVTYTGNGSTSATVGHGLGVAPVFYVGKNRSSSSNWLVLTTATGSMQFGYLNLTDAFGTPSQAAPTSTVINILSAGGETTNGNEYVIYAFAPVEGYSAFGSYTGNGSSDGPFVFCNFRPRWMLIRKVSGDQWAIYDTARMAINPGTSFLYANGSFAEYTDDNVYAIDMVSNGFKIRNNVGGILNTNGSQYIYAAFAENPFKYARAR